MKHVNMDILEEVLGMVYLIIMYIINFGVCVKLLVGIIVVVV